MRLVSVDGEPRHSYRSNNDIIDSQDSSSSLNEPLIEDKGAENDLQPIDEEYDDDERCSGLYIDCGVGRLVKSVFYGLLACLVGMQITILALAIYFLKTSTTGFEAKDPTFPLYKNTDFERCSSVQSYPINCTEQMSLWLGLEHLSGGPGILLADLSPQFPNVSDSHSWCALMSCLNGYKVIPSSFYPSAMMRTRFTFCLSLNLSIISLAWPLCGSWKAAPERKKDCQGLKDRGIFDWIFTIWDVCGPFIWWWYSVLRRIFDPTQSSTMSLIAWTTPWKYAFNLRLHPFQCWLQGHPRLRKILRWTLWILTLVQWSATFYPMALGHHKFRGFSGGKDFPGYDCLESQISSAPGTSNCTAPELCSKTGLFTNFPGNNMHIHGLSLLYNLTHFILTFALLAPTASSLRIPFLELTAERTPKEEQKFQYTLFGGCLMGLILAILLLEALAVLSIVIDAKITRRDGVVVVDTACHAVHVSLSSWRYYLDVDDKYRALRIVRSWFAV